jgi:hypothetical protein
MPTQTVIERIKEKIRVKRNTHPNVGQLAIAGTVPNPGTLDVRSSLLCEKKQDLGSRSRERKVPFQDVDATAHSVVAT